MDKYFCSNSLRATNTLKHQIMKSRILKVFIAAFFVFAFKTSDAQSITEREIDSLVKTVLTAFDVPGIAVSVIKDGKVVLEKGYGVRSLNSKLPVNEHTLFGIASNSKAFTTAALGILVDEGKVSWDDKVRDHIPEFKMYSPYVTEEFTIRDMLTHRSGLGLGAGDLMFWPDSSSFTTEDVIHNLRYLKQVSGFRTKYDYDNLMYILAGEVVKRVSGQPWEDFIEERIIRPLGMTESAASLSRVKDKSNIIDPHAPVDGKVQVIRRDWNNIANAAGGINSSVHDMTRWVMMQLNDGRYGPDLSKRIFSSDVHDEMWTPQTIITNRPSPYYNSHFYSYGLGWFLSDVAGYKQATHTGGLAGIVTEVTLIPEINLGIIVFTNQQSGAAFRSITNYIKDAYIWKEKRDWIKVYKKSSDANIATAEKITGEIWKDIEAQQEKEGKTNLEIFTGTYSDDWFGDVDITMKNGKLRFVSKRSYLLTGDMLPYNGNTFVVKWDNRSFDADAFVTFAFDTNGKPNTIKLKPISPLTDFSFDFADLYFTRKNAGKNQRISP